MASKRRAGHLQGRLAIAYVRITAGMANFREIFSSFFFFLIIFYKQSVNVSSCFCTFLLPGEYNFLSVVFIDNGLCKNKIKTNCD